MSAATVPHATITAAPAPGGATRTPGTASDELASRLRSLRQQIGVTENLRDQ